MDTKRLFKKAVNILTLSSFLVWNLAAAVPEGGTVAQGSASISQSGSTTTINQTSQNTVINWHGFDTAATESVKFTQPNASSIALNRINSGTPTNFNGSLSANGQVWILNPSGVLFGASSKVDVAGLLVTTHNITDSNFMAGNYLFAFDPNNSNSKIINNGLISIKDSGIIALVGPGVENNGTIIANLGKVYLSSGSAFVLDMYGDQLINFGASPAVQNGYVSNSGLIHAVGGKVHMTANAAAGILDNVISMSGTITATTASTGRHGEIILNGGHAGRTKVTGKLNAADGGMIETSGTYVDLADAEINPGVGGTWLLDPLTIDIAAQYGNLIQNQLQNGVSVILSTGVSLATPGTGIIFANQAITWNTSASLTLMAYSSIFVTAPIIATNGSSALILHADTGLVGGTVSFSGAGSVNTNGVALIYYHPTGGNYAAPTNFAPFFPTNQPTAFMTINNFSDLLNVGVNPAGNYLLNADIDTANALNNPVFNNTNFTGIFDGHDYLTGGTHTISNVFLTTSAPIYVGAIASINLGTIQNVIVTGNVFDTAAIGVGGIAGYNGGTVNLAVFNGNISGASGVARVGGIAGVNDGGVITGSGSYGVILNASTAGGIAGLSNNGTITNDYSQMSIAGANRGGIIGTALGNVIFQYVYYAGNSSGMDAFIGNGGPTTLVLDPFIYLYASDHCTGCTTNYLTTMGGTGLGLPDASLVQSTWESFAGFTFNAGQGSWTILGPQLPTIIQLNTASNFVLLSGSLSTPAVQTVSLYGGNNFIGNITTSATGDFGFEYNPDVAAYSFYLATTNGATVKGAILKTEPTSVPVTNLNITNNVVTVDGGSGFSNANLAVAVSNAPYSVSGNDLTLNSGISFLTTAITPYTLNGNITTSGTGNLTFNAPVTLSVSPTLTTTAGSIIFNSTVNGGFNLALSAVAVTFNDLVGNSTLLASLDVVSGSNNIHINTSAISTTGAQYYSGFGAVLVNAPGLMTFTGSDIVFSVGVDNLTVPATSLSIVGDLVLDAPLGNIFGIFGGYDYFNSLTVSGSTTFNNPNFVAVQTLQNQTYNGPVILNAGGGAVGFATTQGGNITFNSTIEGPREVIVALPNPLSVATFNGVVGGVGGSNPLSSLSISGSSAATVNINTSEINTTGAQNYGSTVILSSDTALTSTTAGITFSSTVNSDGTPRALTLDAFSPMVLTGNIGNLPGGILSTLHIINQTNINTPVIHTVDAQLYDGAVVLGNNVNLTVDNGVSGQIIFSGTVTGALYNLVIDPLAIVQFNSDVNIASLNVQATQEIDINTANILTSGNQFYDGPLVLQFNPGSTLTSTGGNITFNGTVDGGFNLAVDAVGVIFNGVVGGTPLASLDVVSGAGFTTINTFAISTTGAQQYLGTGIVLVQAPGLVTLTGSDIVFTTGVDNLVVPSADLSIVGNLVLDAPSGNMIGLFGGFNYFNSLSVSGSTTINNPNLAGIQTLQNQTYNGPVTVNAGLSFAGFATTQGGNITFNSTIDGARDVLVVLANPVSVATFNGVVGGTTPLTQLTVSGSSSATTNINTSSIKTTGAQSYGPKVILITDTALTSTGGDVTFNSTVDGPGGLIVNVNSGTMFANGNMGFGTPLGYLTVNGTAQGVNIISVGDINMGPFNVVTNDLVQSLAGNVNFTGGPVTLSANLDVIAAEQIFFGAGANGVTGPFALSAQSLNPLYGPTGQGVTGTVNVATFTLGGPGGGHLSQNYPGTESFVAGQGAGQAIMNTIISPDFSSSGAIYCVNNFCALLPVPPTNRFPRNIPDTQTFDPPAIVNCSAGGCSNLSIIMGSLSQTGTVSCIHGFVEARNINGEVRILMLGDPIYAGDTLTANNSSTVCVKPINSTAHECIAPNISKTMEESAYLPGSRVIS